MRSRGFAATIFVLSLLGCESDKPVDRPTPTVPPARAPSLDDVFPLETSSSGRAGKAASHATARLDDAYQGDERIDAIRLIYQVHAELPRAAKNAAASTAELAILVDDARLRARFVAPGWPKPGDSQVRMRADRTDAYVFDARGGRVLGPRGVAAWFNGGSARRPPTVWVGDAKEDDARAPTDPLRLLCAFVASWAGREGASRVGGACAQGVFPDRFRVGMWRARLSARVDVQIARHELRADHLEPPASGRAATFGVWLKPAALARLGPGADVGQRALLRIHNASSAGMVVAIDGHAVGWVEAGAQLPVELPRAGSYEVGAVQPLGLFAAARRTVSAPGLVRLPR